MTKQTKKGFTLVELSIVLVIIGLLIGGILAAQSMISTAKIQALIRQTGSFDAAIANFETKFNGLPGDSSVVDATNGDNDGLIDSGIGATAATAATVVGETASVWLSLSNSGLKKDEGIGSYTAGYVVNTSVPKSKAGSSGTGIYIFGETAIDALDATSASNAYIIMDCSEMTTTTLDCKSGLNGPDAIAFDTKLDDGVGTTGNVVGFDGADLATWAALVDATEAAYSPTTTTNDSAILVTRLGINTGVLK